MAPAIVVENVSKRYRLARSAGTRAPYRTLRDDLARAATYPLRWARGEIAPKEDFWALKDVSFEVQPGEVVGVIGRNGAGKSTLLKVLSRITKPTGGRVRLRGRVGSLLEVGTGFHPELTGRENIFLSGAVLGMKRAEIKRKFDEIVAFAEVEKFLDTPVKRYSSGMYMRLAFAVAAHLEPEILVVDEVLAVGDAGFQKKCLGKMGEVAKGGRTVLFVSHNMGAIRTLCKSGLLLRQGRLAQAGPVGEVLSEYNSAIQSQGAVVYEAPTPGPKTPHLTRVEVRQHGTDGNVMAMDKPVEILCDLDPGGGSCAELVVGVLVRNSEGVVVLHSSDEFAPPGSPKGLRRTCRIPPYALGEGGFYVTASLGVRNISLHEKREDLLHFQVAFAGTLEDRTTGNQWKGVCGPGLLQWE
jgi:lipopolysaccharide transport system ATP-binding protein